jgi:phosphotransferase system enzyme I (PtsI)
MVLKGIPVSDGIALGSMLIYKPVKLECKESYCTPETALQEWEYLQQGMESALNSLVESMNKAQPKQREILEAHQSILEDLVIQEEIKDKIIQQHYSASWAVWDVYENLITLLAQVEDPLIKERVEDLKDVRGRLLSALAAETDGSLEAQSQPFIIVADDLPPSVAATMDASKVLGIVCEQGSATSHTAILARSLGVPAVLGVKGLLNQIKEQENALIGLDGTEGTVYLSPEPQHKEILLKKQLEHEENKKRTANFLYAPAATRDGVRVQIGLNLEADEEGHREKLKAVDFVGLLRTEFLFMNRTELPDEETQFKAYKSIIEQSGQQPVILRTLDIGGDKEAPCLKLPSEENPFLGNRALRICFERPQLFRTQLRAALRASVYGNLWIMFPMVSRIEDIRKAKEMVEQVRQELADGDVPVASRIPIGIMVETPSIALIPDLAAREVDFASIGTNDLCQYLMAADRHNQAVSQYYQPYHPAMFRLIQQVHNGFEAVGKSISVCGEMAGDVLSAAVFAGMGIRKLSMGIHQVAAVKEMLARYSVNQLQAAANQVTQLATAHEVKTYLQETFALCRG